MTVSSVTPKTYIVKNYKPATISNNLFFNLIYIIYNVLVYIANETLFYHKKYYNKTSCNIIRTTDYTKLKKILIHNDINRNKLFCHH